VSGALLTPEQVAERLQVPKSWVYRAAREGRLPRVPLGRYVRFDADALDRFIAEQLNRTDNGGGAA
jgi:excisionase family DNA binding protein